MNRTAINRKSVILLVIFCILFAAIAARLAYIQLIWNDELRQQAVQQWTRELGIYPKRGTIYDCNGLVLAVSVSRSSLQATPNDISDSQAVAELLSPILSMDVESIVEKLSNKSQALVWIKRLLTDEEAQQIKNLAIKGLDLIDEPARIYPNNSLASQVLGFTTKYADADGHTGQEGIELYYNTDLKGEPGTILRETDNSGKEIADGSEIIVESTAGNNIVLTLDATLQSYLEQAADEAMAKYQAKGVYAVAMDTNTGAILALVNKPDYDPNDPPRNLSVEEMQALTKNMVCQINLDPGSTFKTIVAAAALEENAVSMSDSSYCPGYKIVDGVRINCSARNGHGTQTLEAAFCNSCNPAFMTIGLEQLGESKFYEYLYKFGFGSKTGIDVLGEESGIIISEEQSVNVDVARMCFGQSFTSTPIQLLNAFNACINGGYLLTPHLLKEITRTVENDDGTSSTEVIYTQPTEVKEQVISEATSALVRQLCLAQVQRGGGKNASVPGYLIGGKTGTSQKYNEDGTISDQDVGSFIAFGPYDDPQITVYFIVDEPQGSVYGSIVAAPFVGDFLSKAFEYMGIEPTEPIEGNVWTPNVVNMELSDAVLALEARGFQVQIEGAGTMVAAQSISSGTVVARDTTIRLTLKQEEPDSSLVKVPDATGLSVTDANTLFYNSGLSMVVRGDGNEAMDQDILPGTYVSKGTVVTVSFTG